VNSDDEPADGYSAKARGEPMAAYSEPREDDADWYDPDTDVIEGGLYRRDADWRICVGCGDHFETQRCDFLNGCEDDEE
jgi:hypothetical protein